MSEAADLRAESPVKFRPMTMADIGTICEIEQEAFPTPWTAAAFTNELMHNHLAKYIVMVADGKIAGYGGMWLIMDEAHITNIAVRRAYRGRKLGERLLREIQVIAMANGMKRMTLEVRVSNAIARNLYEKLGFRPSGVRRGYYSDNNEDALIMWAELPHFDEDDDWSS